LGGVFEREPIQLIVFKRPERISQAPAKKSNTVIQDNPETNGIGTRTIPMNILINPNMVKL
jgi:hypothetical protein